MSPPSFHFGDVVTCLSPFEHGMVIELAHPRHPRPTRTQTHYYTPPHYVVLANKRLYTVPATQLRWSAKKPYRQAKVQYLFSQELSDTQQRIQYDDVALYSATDQVTATHIATFCRTLDGVDASSTVTDATSCIGGNTVAFAKQFAAVRAVEIDPTRFEMLRHNAKLLLDKPTLAKVSFHLADYTDTYARHTQDIVFIDPPWGGKRYKQQAQVELFLGDTPLSTVVDQLRTRCAHVVIKVPVNFNVKALVRVLRTKARVVRLRGRMMVVVVSW